MLNQNDPMRACGKTPEADPRADYERFRTEQMWIAQMKEQAGLLSLTVIVSVLLFYFFHTGGVWLLLRLLRAAGYSPRSLDALNQLYGLFVYVASFLLPFLAYARLIGYPPRAIARDKPHPPVLAACIGVSLGISVAGALCSFAVSMFFALFGLFPPDLRISLSAEPFALVLGLLNLTLIPALIEEFTMRGVLLGSLRRYGDRFAIVISALIFALMHRNMAQLPNALLMGLALGYFVVKTNSIWTGAAIHFVNNLLAVAVNMAAAERYSGLLAQLSVYLLYLAAAFCGWRYFRKRGLDMELLPSACPAGEKALYHGFWRGFPVVMMLLLFAWVIFLNFTRA